VPSLYRQSAPIQSIASGGLAACRFIALHMLYDMRHGAPKNKPWLAFASFLDLYFGMNKVQLGTVFTAEYL
jgi:hypothetical protein